MKVLISQKTKDPRIKDQKLKSLLTTIQTRLKIKTTENLELSVYFTDDEEIRELNRDYRGKDYPTDVLSFPQEGEMLGDVVVSIPTIEKQAKDHGVTFDEELYLMFIHGTLHLLGYDHETSEEEEKEMFELQESILEEFLNSGAGE